MEDSRRRPPDSTAGRYRKAVAPPESDPPAPPRRRHRDNDPEEYGELLYRMVELERNAKERERRLTDMIGQMEANTQRELAEVSGRLKSIEDEEKKRATRRMAMILSFVTAVFIPTATSLISGGKTIESINTIASEVQQLRITVQESEKTEARHSEAIRLLERQLEKARP